MVDKLEQLEDRFFKDLKSYNNNNFKTLLKADLSENSAVVHKAFSSVVTRYFIFREKHVDEMSESEFNMLYFRLKIDLISQYFANYPDSDVSTLVEFQNAIRAYNDRSKGIGDATTP